MTCKKFQQWLSTRQPDTDLPEDSDLYAHFQSCSLCKSLYTIDTGLENTIKKAFALHEIPDSLPRKVDSALDHANPQSVISWRRITGLSVACAVVAILAFSLFFNQPFRYDNLQQLSETAIASHLKGNTAMSFSSQNIDKAVAMLSQELKFKVMLPDLNAQGYVLLGGRLCALGKCKIAYLFYEKENKISSVVIMDYDHLDFEMAEGSRFSNKTKGYHTDIWKENGQVYAMVY